MSEMVERVARAFNAAREDCMTSCDFCTGTYWLSDQLDLGPCVCCTPQAILEAQEMYADAEAECTRLHDAAKGRDEEIANLTVQLEAMDDATADLAARDVELGDAVEALALYLVSIGESTRPVRCANPDLQRLADTLGL